MNEFKPVTYIDGYFERREFDKTDRADCAEGVSAY